MNTCREMLKKVEKLNVNVVCVYVAHLIEEELKLRRLNVSNNNFEKMCNVVLSYCNDYIGNYDYMEKVLDIIDLYEKLKKAPNISELVLYRDRGYIEGDY